jgi:hypothetical protein
MAAGSNIANLEEGYFTQAQPRKQLPRVPLDIGQQILSAIGSVEYGSVEIVIHDGKVMHIERREKIRLGGHDAGPGK